MKDVFQTYGSYGTKIVYHPPFHLCHPQYDYYMATVANGIIHQIQSQISISSTISLSSDVENGHIYRCTAVYEHIQSHPLAVNDDCLLSPCKINRLVYMGRRNLTLHRW